MALVSLPGGLDPQLCEHLREELLPFGLRVGSDELVNREAELLAAHQPSYCLRSGRRHFRLAIQIFHSLPSRIHKANLL